MIKVLLVDDSAIIRKSIKSILDNQPEIQVIGECKDGNPKNSRIFLTTYNNNTFGNFQ